MCFRPSSGTIRRCASTFARSSFASITRARRRTGPFVGVGRRNFTWKSEVTQQGGQFVIEAEIHLHGLEAKAVRVELYADGINGGAAVRQEMTRLRDLAGVAGGGLYSATVSAARPATNRRSATLAPPVASRAPSRLDVGVNIGHGIDQRGQPCREPRSRPTNLAPAVTSLPGRRLRDGGHRQLAQSGATGRPNPSVLLVMMPPTNP